MLVHPTLTQLTELGLTGMAKAFKELYDHPEAQALEHADWLGLLLDREVAERQTAASRPGCAPPSCASPRPVSKTSTLPPLGASIGGCSRSSPPASGSRTTRT